MRVWVYPRAEFAFQIPGSDYIRIVPASITAREMPVVGRLPFPRKYKPFKQLLDAYPLVRPLRSRPSDRKPT